MDYMEILAPVGLVLLVVVGTAIVYFVGTAIKGRRADRQDGENGPRHRR